LAQAGPYVDVEFRIPNIDKARELPGYDPKVTLEVGIEKTTPWYAQRMNADVGGRPFLKEVSPPNPLPKNF